MKPKVNIELSVKTYKKLANFLDSHEDDIAWDVNDFGSLREVYIEIFEQEPKKQ